MLYEDSIIENGEFKGRKVGNIIKKDKKNIFKLIKDGYILDDNILKKYNITKNIHSVAGKCVIADHDNTFLKSKLKKDDANANDIINEMNNYNDDKYQEEDEDVQIENYE